MFKMTDTNDRRTKAGSSASKEGGMNKNKRTGHKVVICSWTNGCPISGVHPQAPWPANDRRQKEQVDTNRR